MSLAFLRDRFLVGTVPEGTQGGPLAGQTHLHSVSGHLTSSQTRCVSGEVEVRSEEEIFGSGLKGSLVQ